MASVRWNNPPSSIHGSGTNSDDPNSPGCYPDESPSYRDNEDGGSYPVSSHSCADTAISGIITVTSHWKIILFGQLMAVFMATRGSTASLQVQCGVSAPAFNASLVYGICFLHFVYFVCIQWRNRQKAKSHSTTGTESAQQQNQTSPYKLYGPHRLPCTRLLLKTPWWKYLLFAFLDVEANYFTYLALRYSSIKSVTLLDTLAIPAAMISSRFVLKRQYSWTHIFGACVCIFGATITIFSDYENEDSGVGYPHAVYGDLLASIGGIFYGLSDTVAEQALKNSGNTEFLGMLGLFGTVISSVQVLILERQAVHELFYSSGCSQGVTTGVMIGLVTSFYAFYVGLGRF